MASEPMSGSPPLAATQALPRNPKGPAKPFLRGRLFAGAAALALLAIGAPAMAQTAPAEGRQVVEQPGPDGLTEDGLYLEADAITEDRETQVITATGSVQARYQGRLLRADSSPV